MTVPAPLTQEEREAKLREAARLLNDVRRDLLFHRFQDRKATSQAAIFALGMLEARVEIALQAAEGAVYWGSSATLDVTDADRAVAGDPRS